MTFGVLGCMMTLIIEAALVATFVPSSNQAALKAAVAMFFIFQVILRYLPRWHAVQLSVGDVPFTFESEGCESGDCSDLADEHHMVAVCADGIQVSGSLLTNHKITSTDTR